jgi:hypothetical protein
MMKLKKYQKQLANQASQSNSMTQIIRNEIIQ